MTEIEGEGRSDAEVVLHAERAEYGVLRRPYRRVRVRKVVVIEEVTLTVAVRHEELVIEEYDIDGDTAASGQEDTGPEAALQFVLHREEPQVQTVARPVELVRVSKERIAGEQRVDLQLREEHVEVDRIRTPDRSTPIS